LLYSFTADFKGLNSLALSQSCMCLFTVRRKTISSVYSYVLRAGA